MWWFWLSLQFGGSPVAWAISVGIFVGLGMGAYFVYRMEKEANQK